MHNHNHLLIQENKDLQWTSLHKNFNRKFVNNFFNWILMLKIDFKVYSIEIEIPSLTPNCLSGHIWSL